MTFTLSPTCHEVALASLITRLEPSSKRTVMSKLLVVLTSFSISLPSRPPATAPTTAPILRVALADLVADHAADHGAAYGAGTSAFALGIDLMHRLHDPAVQADRDVLRLRRRVRPIRRARLVEIADRARLGLAATDPAHHCGDACAAKQDEDDARDPEKRM